MVGLLTNPVLITFLKKLCIWSNALNHPGFTARAKFNTAHIRATLNQLISLELANIYCVSSP